MCDIIPLRAEHSANFGKADFQAADIIAVPDEGGMSNDRESKKLVCGERKLL